MASITSPAHVRYLALLSLTVPFAILFNFGFIIFWLFTDGKWRSLLSLAVLIFSYKLILAVLGLNFVGKNDMKSGPQKLKVMTWNVHGLGIYDLPFNKATADKIFEFINRQNPDILCLPEFYTQWDDAMKPYSKRFLHDGNFKEYRFVYDNTLGTKIYVGTAFFSKYPLKHFEEVALASNIKMLQCDVVLPEDRMMRVYFIHLQSFMLRDKEKALIEDVKHRNKPLEIGESKSFARRFNAAYEKRASQVDSALTYIRRSPYPVLICGDLNDLPGSYTYTTLKGNLKDAFAEKGRGLGRTYNQILPTLRIDYIFYDPRLLRITGFNCPRLSLSDHNPVIANFEIASGALR
jgi:endonuclease/exonuclease/phosphatase family metal-dependent hydrolase